jgi:hypothetical protein
MTSTITQRPLIANNADARRAVFGCSMKAATLRGLREVIAILSATLNAGKKKLS